MVTETCLLYKRYQLSNSLYFDFNEEFVSNKSKAQIFNVILKILYTQVYNQLC